MKKVIVATVDKKTEEFVVHKCEDIHEEDGFLVLKRQSEKLRFTDEKAVETYYKRKLRGKDVNVIEVVNPGEFPKHDKGNNWILSVGLTITGKDAAHRLEPSRQ